MKQTSTPLVRQLPDQLHHFSFHLRQGYGGQVVVQASAYTPRICNESQTRLKLTKPSCFDAGSCHNRVIL
jgi:hypothetical protein